VRKELAVACALIRKHYHDHKKGEIKVELDLGNTDRSFLFGRALAYLHQIEWSALSDEERKARRTNAQRLFPSFSQHPAKTIGILRSKVNPYLGKIHRANGYVYLERGLEDVLRIIGDGMTNASLTEMYLVGYSTQINDFFKKKDNIDNIKEDKPQ
jgi:CRISPR-associated protein Csd1